MLQQLWNPFWLGDLGNFRKGKGKEDGNNSVQLGTIYMCLSNAILLDHDSTVHASMPHTQKECVGDHP